MRETSVSEPPPKHRKKIRWHRNRSLHDVPGRAWRRPTYWPCGVRCAGGVTLILAFVWNVRTWPAMPREKVQAAPTARPKVPMPERGGLPRSSDEAGVMLVERRGRVTEVGSGQPATGGTWSLNGRRQPSNGGTSRMTRECQVRICERLGVKFPGPTRRRRNGLIASSVMGCSCLR